MLAGLGEDDRWSHARWSYLAQSIHTESLRAQEAALDTAVESVAEHHRPPPKFPGLIGLLGVATVVLMWAVVVFDLIGLALPAAGTFAWLVAELRPWRWNWAGFAEDLAGGPSDGTAMAGTQADRPARRTSAVRKYGWGGHST